MTATDPIERVVLTHIQIPFKEPFRISGGEVAIKDAILVEVETAVGDRASARARRWRRASAIRPTRPRDAGTTWPTHRARPPRPLLRRRPRTSPSRPPRWDASRFAVAGAETALWDLLGQARHASIAELLGASDLRIDMGVESGLAVGLYPSIVELIKTIEAHLEAGYRRVKIKIRPGQDVELVRAVRQHIGDVPLMVDANGAYTAADLDVFRELDEYDLLMFEQPMAAGRPRRPGRARRQAVTHAGLPGRDGREPRAHRRGDPAGRRPDRQPQDPARRRARPGPGHPRPLLPARRGLLGRRDAGARHRPGPRASTWRPCPTASTPPISSPARGGSSTTTRSRSSSWPARGSSRSRPAPGWDTTSIPSRCGDTRCASRSSQRRSQG